MFRNRKKNLSYLLILCIPAALFLFQTEAFRSVKLAVFRITAGPLHVISIPFQELKKIIFYHRTFDEYRRLSKETDVLKARLVGMEEVLRENTRLEKLLEFKRRLIYSAVTANVIARDPTRWNASMVIDKGMIDGIEEGMPVVNALGVVGKIIEVGKDTSKVILLTDPQFSVAALVQRPRESGVVSGTLDGRCRLRYLDENADIKVGDKIITSKLSSSFPESLIIGDVVEVLDNPRQGAKEAFVQPAVSLSQIEEVLVILK